MGYMSVVGPCFACRKVFTFSPTKVPSHQGEPVCRDCMDAVNEQRRRMGLPPHPILPGAYEPDPEGIEEEE